MASIREVAKHAGVAISTVSKVLNGYSGVSEETRRKVKQAAEELNFVPNSIASALSSKRTGRVALLLNTSMQPTAIDEIPMQYISGGLRAAQELHMDVITVFFSMLKDMSVEEITRYFQTQSIEGIIVYGMTGNDQVLWDLAKSGVFRMVLVDVPLTGERVSSIGIDHRQAQIDVARATIMENAPSPSSRLLYIAGADSSYASRERLRGMQELAEELGAVLQVEEGNFSEQAAREITFRSGEQSDIIICSSDLMAIGAMRALIEMDIFRPVCGFDGLILMGYAGKQMNTIAQNFAEISAAAMEEMQHLLNGHEGRRVVTPHRMERMQYLEIIR